MPKNSSFPPAPAPWASAAAPTWRPKQCTDVHVITPHFQGWAHNEDERPFLGYYLVLSNITTATSAEQYVGFAYAGTVVGWAWGFNNHGHAHSVNAIPLAPNQTTVGKGVNFVARDVLRATSLDDALRRGSVANQATAQHFNFGNYNTPGRHISLETTSSPASPLPGMNYSSTRVITATTKDLCSPPLPGHCSSESSTQ